MNFLDQILASLKKSGDLVVLQELRDGRLIPVAARQLLDQVMVGRAYLRRLRLRKGDRCALLAHNSIQWVAMDLAIMAEGLTVVPLYARQAAGELVAMMKDCSPALICCGDQTLADAIVQEWPEAPPNFSMSKVFSGSRAPLSDTSLAMEKDDVVTIIYTSGTSGEAKGVMLNAGNITHMIDCTSGRLDQLMKKGVGQDSVFHYLPFCFAGSWIMLLTCLLRGSRMTLNTDLGKLASDMRASTPEYFLNVPALLERMRKAVDEQLCQAVGVPVEGLNKAEGGAAGRPGGKIGARDGGWAGAGGEAGIVADTRALGRCQV